MKKFWIQIGVLLIVVFGALYVSFNQEFLSSVLPAKGLNSNLTQKQIMVGDTVVNIEVADTAAKRAQGLSGRESLASGSGMLFVFESSKKYQFWMKGMKFPLDFVFIREGKVADLIRNVPPPLPNQADSTLNVYEPVAQIDMMLEVNAGFIDANNIKIGNQVFNVYQP